MTKGEQRRNKQERKGKNSQELKDKLRRPRRNDQNKKLHQDKVFLTSPLTVFILPLISNGYGLSDVPPEGSMESN
jgi:hypothetical protein